MENKNSEIYDIDPYIDSFSYFLDNMKMKQNFLNLNNSVQNDEETENFYSNYIKEIINNIKISTLDEDETRNEKLIFYKNPKIAFDFLLNELHKIYGGKEEYSTKIISKELNKESAYNLFKKYKDNDKSYISDNFFGVKAIEKKCNECKMTQYNYKYLKTIPIKISDVGNNIILDIETYLKKMQRKFPKEEFCTTCGAKKKHKIKIKIEKYPKILILVIYGNFKFKIKSSIKHGEYELIAAEIRNSNIFWDIINFFVSGNKNYKFINKETNKSIDDESLENEIPIVLFYKKREQMIIDNDTGSNSKDSFCSSKSKSTDNNETQDIEINPKINEKLKNNIPKIKEKNNNSKEKNNNSKEKNNNNSKEKKDITLYFKLSKSEKELTINTLNNESFSKIIQKLKKQNEELNSKKIEINKIMFNNKEIYIYKTPNDYKIKDKSKIIIIE